MLKKTLLATSALVFSSSVSFAASDRTPPSRPDLPDGTVVVRSIDGIPITVVLPSGNDKRPTQSFPDVLPVRHKGATFSNLSKDRNAQFLSWYGFQVSSYFYSSCSSQNCDFSSSYTREAIPIVGAGKAVTTIRVPNAGGKFTVSLYTNSVSNTPGTPIASATATGLSSGYCCTQLVTVSIASPKLKSGTPYWIVEQGAVDKENGKNEVTWLSEDTDYTGDAKSLSQYHTLKGWRTSRNHGSTHYTSPWEGASSLTEPAAELE